MTSDRMRDARRSGAARPKRWAAAGVVLRREKRQAQPRARSHSRRWRSGAAHAHQRRGLGALWNHPADRAATPRGRRGADERTCWVDEARSVRRSRKGHSSEPGSLPEEGASCPTTPAPRLRRGAVCHQARTRVHTGRCGQHSGWQRAAIAGLQAGRAGPRLQAGVSLGFSRWARVRGGARHGGNSPHSIGASPPIFLPPAKRAAHTACNSGTIPACIGRVVTWTAASLR